MQIQAYEFRLLEFPDRTGTIRTVAGCSLLGRDEFFARLSQLKGILESADPASQIQDVLAGATARHHVIKCLELNGINPDWVTLPMAVELLLSPGTLIEFNLPPKSEEAAPSTDKPATTESLIAALATHTQSLSEALNLASDPSLPANRLLEVVRAKTELTRAADPQERKRDQIRANQQRARDDLQRQREAREAAS